MKIDPASSRLSASQAAQSSNTARSNAPSFSVALSKATAALSIPDASTFVQADFTSMTRQQLQVWSNQQIRSGNMSLDEGRPFMAMAMHIPVSGNSGSSGGGGGTLQAGSDGERIDFTQKVRAGLAGAASRNDEVTRKMLESALNIMLQHQGETIGVDTRA